MAQHGVSTVSKLREARRGSRPFRPVPEAEMNASEGRQCGGRAGGGPSAPRPGPHACEESTAFSRQITADDLQLEGSTPRSQFPAPLLEMGARQKTLVSTSASQYDSRHAGGQLIAASICNSQGTEGLPGGVCGGDTTGPAGCSEGVGADHAYSHARGKEVVTQIVTPRRVQGAQDLRERSGLLFLYVQGELLL